MAYNTKKMLEDINGDLIPQYYDPVEDAFKPLTNDPRDVRLTGSIDEEIWRNVSIPAGTFISEKLLFKGSKVGISFRGFLARYFKIRMQPIDFNSGLAVGKSIDLFTGDESRNNMITVSLTLDVSSYNIFLENLETNEDNTLDVRFFNITDFV